MSDDRDSDRPGRDRPGGSDGPVVAGADGHAGAPDHRDGHAAGPPGDAPRDWSAADELRAARELAREAKAIKREAKRLERMKHLLAQQAKALARDEERDAEQLSREAEREAERLQREAERLEHEAERLAAAEEHAAERLAHEAEREAERAAREAERLVREAEREAEQLAREAERLAHEAEREAEQAARARQRADHAGDPGARDSAQQAAQAARDAEQRATDAAQRARDKADDAARRAREATQRAEQRAQDQAEQAAQRARDKARSAEQRATQKAWDAAAQARDKARDAEQRARDKAEQAAQRARHAADAWRDPDPRVDGEPDGGGARGDGSGRAQDDTFVGRWERRQERQWQRVEQAWRRHAAQRERWEARRAQRPPRFGHRRWKELQAEREMWRRMGRDKRAWGPWWLQAKMRKRIFLWLAVAFAAGGIHVYVWPEPRWWHAVVALISLSMMSGAIAFRVTQPLIMIVRVAQDIGDGKLETRLDVQGQTGETRLLAIAINDMAERIEQQLKDQRQLLAAVSHELRTPLGHMRVLLDTARDGASRSALAELEREVLVLDDLVGRLLASSRLEFGNLDCRPLDLGELVSDVATAAGVAPEAIEAIGDVGATVDPTLVRRAVANLLDNARVHGGGAVAVRIERRARQVAIEVDDAGPGVPADRRADAFRAFVPSRAGGLGLGLALVSRIAVAHGGGAWIADRPGGGARVGFTVELEPRPAANTARA